MIFDVEPSQIEKLDSKELVELLRKLLYAEAQDAGISLRGVSVPLQITVSDGGEDARIAWEGGNESTDYLPSRFCIFQSKATDPGSAGWEKEVWTKPTQKANAKRELNDAVKAAIAKKGSYIGFTSAALVGSKYDDRIVAIKKGIKDAGSNPDQLTAIDIYDANKIAGWASKYPSIAVWLNERQSGLTLKGFQTIGSLGKKTDFVSIEQVEDKASRFIIENTKGNELTFEKVKERIINDLNDSKKSIRIIGPSGVGKTRFVYEIFKDETTTTKIILTTSAIYCDFRDIGNHLFQIVQSLSDVGNSSLIIVDECSREDAIRLGAIVEKEGSKLRIITIGNDNEGIPQDNNCLNIFVEPADDELIEGIIRQRYPKADPSDINFIKQLSGGYPRIAILATDNYLDGFPILKSVEDVVNRILTGSGIKEVEQIRAIECLALFDQLGADENFSDQIDFVAENLARQTGDEMYEHLAYAANSSLVDRRGIFFKAQPVPIAAFLGAKRLDLLRVNTILNFIETASPELRRSFLNQWCYFDNSKTAAKVTQWLLSRNGWCGSLEHLKTDIGSQCLKAIVYIDPDAVADVVRYLYGNLSIDELNTGVTNKRDFVQILVKLVARKKTFYMIAPILMRLSVIDNNETYLPNAKSSFKQLFQLHLSGTEAEPAEKFAIIDQGISSGDERIILSCIEALRSTLERSYFTRLSIDHQIGSQPPKEWQPNLLSEVFDFHRNGLQQLMKIRSTYKDLAEQCENIIASNIRSLLCENLFNEIQEIVKEIVNQKGMWIDAINNIGDWLYFDRKEAPEEFSQQVKKLYDDILPTDLIQQSLLYAKLDLYNPDLKYSLDDKSTHDYEYSFRKLRELAHEIALDLDLTKKAIQTMIKEDSENVFLFAYELSTKIENPLEVFQFSINELDSSTEKTEVQFIRGLLKGVNQRHPENIRDYLKIISKSNSLKNRMINIYSAVNISVEILNEIVQFIQQGNIPIRNCAVLSYGKGLNHLETKDILPLIDELILNHGSDGLWAAIEIIVMYQDDKKELDAHLVDKIDQIISSPELLGQEQSRTRDGHLFQRLISMVYKHCGIDDKFAIGLSNIVIKLCQTENRTIFSALDSYLQRVIILLVKEKPIILWEQLSLFFERATPLEIYYLKKLTGIPLNLSDNQSHNKAGVLFGIPYGECKKWAEVNSEVRSPFLCSFYPVMEIETTANSELVSDSEVPTEKVQQCRWHPDLERLTKDFGHVKEFREALYDRLPRLEIYLIPLKTWFTHPVSEMAFWAKDVHRSLENQIEQEQEREQERRM